jgi:ribosomal protection tetracycline resistance protein
MAISPYAWRQLLNIINLGILAHVDAGKTTVTESILHTTGAVRQLGRVDHGNTVTDSLHIEREHGITVRAATVSIRYKNVKINILDTPGHVDFIAEVERSLAVLDAAVLVISAREGVQSQTAVLFRALQKLRIPALFFINKLDRLGANADDVLAQIRAQLTDAVLPRQKITGIGRDASVETLKLEDCAGVMDLLFQADDRIAGMYMENKAIPPDLLWEAYLQAVKHCDIYPVYAGVALTELGIPALLDAITSELPLAENGGSPLCAFCYKLEFNERLGRICYLRVYGGAIVIRKLVTLYGTDEPFRITLLSTPDMGQLKGTEAVCCGDIAVIPCYDMLKVGSVLGQVLPPIRELNIAEPLLLTRVQADYDVPRTKLLEVLLKLSMEDPLLNMQTNEQTGALELRVFGQVQMEILRELAFERFGLKITLEEPQTIFREFPARKGTGDVPWGETPFEAAIGITIEPLPLGSGVQYETKVNYGYLYASFQNAVREGLLHTLHHGLYGWEVTDCKITLQWAKYSSVTSTPADYRNIAPVAVIRALNDAGTELMEPMLTYTLTVPADMAGRATYDLNMMHATMYGMTAQGNEITYSGQVSLEASKLYSQAVAAYTKGTGVFTVRQNGYALFTGDKGTVINKGCELPNAEKYLLTKSGRMI